MLAVPDDAVSTLAGVSTVYVIENGKARQQQITLGARQDKLVEIIDGLKGDETLATSQPEPARHRRHRDAGEGAGEGAAAADGGGRGRRRGAAGSAAMKLADVSVKRPVFAIMMTRRAHRAGRVLVRDRSAST